MLLEHEARKLDNTLTHSLPHFSDDYESKWDNQLIHNLEPKGIKMNQLNYVDRKIDNWWVTKNSSSKWFNSKILRKKWTQNKFKGNLMSMEVSQNVVTRKFVVDIEENDV